MALHIDAEIERLATEVARMAGESKTEAIRQALADRKRRLEAEGKTGEHDDMRWLREEIWSTIPKELLGKRIPKAEWDALNDEEDV